MDLNRKDTFILQNFQTPATISLSSISQICKKKTLFFSLPVCYLSPSLRRRQPTPNIAVYSLCHGKHLRFQNPLALVPSLPSFPKPRVMFLMLFFFFFF
jgi:hypothetical protein